MTSRTLETFRIFLVLGLTSFGGPVAHLGYFRDAFVTRRQWLSEQSYADLVALCQFLPGPASSQVGMAIGLHRAGYAGLFAAWVGFTLPSVVLLVGFAYGAAAIGLGAGALQGLKAAAVAVVAYAVLGMAQSFLKGWQTILIALVTLALLVLFPFSLGQVLVIALGALAGLFLLKAPVDAATSETLSVPVKHYVAVTCLILFFLLLLGLPLLAAYSGDPFLRMTDSFYRTASLVFGGGHVVLPLLQTEFVRPGLMSHESFLAGYGAAQAVPGPLFSFAAYIGASMQGLWGALVAIIAIYIPSFLLVVGALPFWDRLRALPRAQAALAGVNAAVVGLLAAALYNPIFVEGITSLASLALALLCFVALYSKRVPVWAIVIIAGIAGQIVL